MSSIDLRITSAKLMNKLSRTKKLKLFYWPSHNSNICFRAWLLRKFTLFTREIRNISLTVINDGDLQLQGDTRNISIVKMCQCSAFLSMRTIPEFILASLWIYVLHRMFNNKLTIFLQWTIPSYKMLFNRTHLFDRDNRGILHHTWKNIKPTRIYFCQKRK